TITRHSANPTPLATGGVMEEEIDLRPYFLALIRQWRTIAVIVTLAVLGGALVAFVLPPSFTASTDVLILPSRSQLSFDLRFVTDDAVPNPDASIRRQSLVAMASSEALEALVRDKLPAELASQKPGALAGRIQVRTDGDLLHIEAGAADAQNAQALADA